MDLSLTSDYVTSSKCPEPYLRRIAEAGFTHVHWCHHWSTDFLYSASEIEQIRRWLGEFGLQVVDLHGSTGSEKNWSSLREYERLAGVELVANRVQMTADLSSNVVIMHAPGVRQGDEENDTAQAQLRTSLDALEPVARRLGVRIAIENGDFRGIRALLSEYPPEFLGLCYDSGHGNMDDKGLDHLDSLKDRLIAVHLHDNDGSGDQHNLPMSGTINWERLAKIIAASSYSKCLSEECNMGGYDMAEEEYLAKAYQVGIALSEMVQAGRASVA